MAFASTAPVSMGKLHEDSHNTVNAQLDLFKVPPTETSLGGGTWVSVQPLSQVESSSQLQLHLPASDEYYTDLQNSYAIVECKVVKGDGTALDANGLKVYPVTNLPHSLFERMTLALNSTDVDHNAAYAQTAYIHSLIDETDASKRGRLTGEGWLDDGATAKDEADAAAAAKTTRIESIKTSKKLSYYMKFFLSVNKQRRHIPPGVSIRLTLNRSSPATCLMSDDNNDGSKVIITKLEWMVRRVMVNPSIVRAHNARLIEGNTFKFPLLKHRTRTFTIPSGVSSHRLVIDQDDAIPSRILLTMLPHEAYVGAYKLSPFKFSNHGLTSTELTVDGVTVGKPIQTDFAKNNYAHAYAHTIASLGQLNSKSSNGISYSDYGENKTILAWSLGSDLPNKDKGNYFHLRRKGCTAVSLKFKDVLPKPLTVLITDEREDLLEIDLEQRVRSVVGVV